MNSLIIEFGSDNIDSEITVKDLQGQIVDLTNATSVILKIQLGNVWSPYTGTVTVATAGKCEFRLTMADVLATPVMTTARVVVTFTGSPPKKVASAKFPFGVVD